MGTIPRRCLDAAVVVGYVTICFYALAEPACLPPFKFGPAMRRSGSAMGCVCIGQSCALGTAAGDACFKTLESFDSRETRPGVLSGAGLGVSSMVDPQSRDTSRRISRAQ